LDFKKDWDENNMQVKGLREKEQGARKYMDEAIQKRYKGEMVKYVT
jgi:hypothetical protein